MTNPSPIIQTADPAGPHPNNSPEPVPLIVRLRFTGSGKEYFRIWIVNILLTIVTLSLYSPWAKVRRLQYFAQNTFVGNHSFYFHGNPMAIFKGRIIAGPVLLISSFPFLESLTSTIISLLLFALLPFVLQRSQRFKLSNTSYRGLRFAFDGTVKQAYLAVGFPYLLAVFLFYLPSLYTEITGNSHGMWAYLSYFGAVLLSPLIHFNWRKFTISHSRFGNLKSLEKLNTGDFYWTYFTAFGLALLVLLAYAIVTVGIEKSSSTGIVPKAIIASLLPAYLVYFAADAIVTARMQNTTWGGTKLGAHYFSSELNVSRYVHLRLKNLALSLVSLGAYRPFADIRLTQLRVESISLNQIGYLSQISRSAGDAISAVGAESADVLGFDMSL